MENNQNYHQQNPRQSERRQPPAPAKQNRQALIALTTGVLSIAFGLLGWFTINLIVVLVSVVFGVVGIVFGAVGVAKAEKTGRGKGIATAGFVCGIIGAVFALVLLPFVTILQKVEKVTDISNSIIDTIIDVFS